jgi:hypothetical protein
MDTVLTGINCFWINYHAAIWSVLEYLAKITCISKFNTPYFLKLRITMLLTVVSNCTCTNVRFRSIWTKHIPHSNIPYTFIFHENRQQCVKTPFERLKGTYVSAIHECLSCISFAQTIFSFAHVNAIF